MNKSSTGLLTALHALVDALCACCVFLVEPDMEFEASMLLFIAYNTLAFVTQPLVGWWLDRKTHHISHLTAAVGLLSVGGLLTIAHSVRLFAISPFLIVLLIGLGNSVFHVYGGKYVSESTGNDIRHLGIFVSSGALGLSVGSQYVSVLLLVGIILLMLCLTCLYHFTLTHQGDQLQANLRSTTVANKPTTLTAGNIQWLLAFIVLIVFIRSFLGSMIPSGSGQGIPYFAVISVLLAVAGKASGGFIARQFGVWPTLIIVLITAGTSFLAGSFYAGFLLAMILLINCSMPLTLYLANKFLPNRQGLSFGLLAAVLAPGVGLAKICQDSTLAYDLLYPLIATIIIEILVLLVLHERRWQVLSLSVVMNILTNIPLNLFALFVLNELSVPAIILLESGVMAIEVLLFFVATRNWQQSIKYSLTCNFCSYGCGLLYGILFM